MKLRPRPTLSTALVVGLAAFSPGIAAVQAPRDEEELAAWLARDDEGDRVWEAIVAGAVVENKAFHETLIDALLLGVSPADLERKLEAEPALAEPTSSLFGNALIGDSGELARRVAEYVAASARSRSNRLGARGGPWSENELSSLLTLQFVEPERFVSDERFRAAVLNILPRAIGEDAPRELRDLLLFSINNVPGVDFAASETIETAWEVARRPSLAREVAFQPGAFTFSPDGVEPIEASIYSLPSRFFTSTEASRFLEQVRAVAPDRTLLVLADLPLRVDLEETARRLNADLIETHGRSYSAWPRDPFSLVRDDEDRVVLLLRPNEQRGRREDNALGLELVQGLPPSVDRAWGELRWARSPVPFHNGQVLLTEDRAWVSLHSLEPHALALLGLDRVPVDRFGVRDGWLAYEAGIRRAASELETFYEREVSFVHVFPESDEWAETVRTLGGGAGYDLDSLITLLASEDGSAHALVADVDAGRELLQSAPSDDLSVFAATFGLENRGPPARAALISAQQTQPALGLDGFVDLVAESLRGRGIEVSRLPIFLVPVSLLAIREELHHEAFLVTWNNVVAERRNGVLRAEGFAQKLAAGDERARAVFRERGYELDLVDPLVRSVILVGGYRCASQHLRK